MRKQPVPNNLLLLLVLGATSSACGLLPQATPRSDVVLSSLDSLDAATKRYYLGWGEYLQGFMGNETQYDVKHTHDIFASGVGGDYEAQTLTGRSFSGGEVMTAMQAIAGKMTKDDMYVEYSSGHGYPGGLGVGMEYSDVAATALRMPAKEVVVFTMACFSGTLVEEFDRHKNEWQDWAKTGRTLFVMSSSTAQEESSTGPGIDPGENGPEGSAGSAYGHSLWKSLIGEADGYLDGVKDGFVSLGEIAAYATAKTQIVGGHTPQVTGVYNPALIMNKVPSQATYAAQVREGGTGGLSDAQVTVVADQSDAAVRAAAGVAQP